jgi:hypothetical protein
MQVLQLSHNAMDALPIALLCLTALTYLDMSYNRMVALPFWIGSSKLQRLKRLNLVSEAEAVLSAVAAAGFMLCVSGCSTIRANCACICCRVRWTSQLSCGVTPLYPKSCVDAHNCKAATPVCISATWLLSC